MPPLPRESGLRSIAMGMAPTAGRCVAASITSAPAGVMGRPSPAGSCWHSAIAQNPRVITRKAALIIRDFMFLLPRSPKMAMFRIPWRSHNLHGIESKEKVFHEFYKRIVRSECRVATDLTENASTSRMNVALPSLDKPVTGHE